MAEIKNIAQLAIDAYHNEVKEYSQKEGLEVLRNALVELNNGSTKLNAKSLRGERGAQIFSIIEEVLSTLIVEGLQGDEYFNALVDFRNIAAGDKNEFVVENSDLFVVTKLADGTQALRRQRIGGLSKTSVSTELRGIKIYEELNRVMAGVIDFNEFIDRVQKSFRQQILVDIQTLWDGVTAAQIGGTNFFPAAGAYSESALIDIIDHVEAAADGKTATIIGTKKAIRKIASAVVADESKSDLYNLGYYGKFNGTPIVCIPQRHKAGTNTFAFSDNVLTIVAGDQKPIKFVYEGESLIIEGDRLAKADLTQEYMYAEKYGMALVAANNTGIGKYSMT